MLKDFYSKDIDYINDVEIDNFLEGGIIRKKYQKTVKKKVHPTKVTKNEVVVNIQQKYKLKTIYPKNSNQRKVFESFNQDKNLVLSGMAGTGKTFLALYLGLRELLSAESDSIDKIYILRSATPTKSIGFLPGSINEKMEAYEEPYKLICSELFENKTIYDQLKRSNKIEFLSTSYLRGNTFSNAFVILDEAQSCTEHEIDTVLTRMGENSTLVICGDIKQDDLIYNIREKSGFGNILKILSKMNSVDIIEFGPSDIVRSGFVKEYILARDFY